MNEMILTMLYSIPKWALPTTQCAVPESRSQESEFRMFLEYASNSLLTS